MTKPNIVAEITKHPHRELWIITYRRGPHEIVDMEYAFDEATAYRVSREFLIVAQAS